MSSPLHEPGGGIPSIGALFSETLNDLVANVSGYLMAGLALVAVVMPLSLVMSLGGMFAMYAVMGVGVLASAGAGAAVAEGGDRDLGDLITVFGGMGSMALGFFVFFAMIFAMVAAIAPVSASINRAIAAQQRGEGPITFGSAFATVRQDVTSSVGSMVLIGIASMIGVLFCYVGMFVPSFLFGFAFCMVALHRKGAFEAMSLSARHAIAHPMQHFVFMLSFLGVSLVAAYVPLVGPIFMMALQVRAYRKMFGDGAEPVLVAA